MEEGALRIEERGVSRGNIFGDYEKQERKVRATGEYSNLYLTEKIDTLCQEE